MNSVKQVWPLTPATILTLCFLMGVIVTTGLAVRSSDIHDAPSAIPTTAKAQQAAKSTTHRNSKEAAAIRYSQADVALYQRLYDLQESGNWYQANRLVKRLQNDGLVSDLLAQRFLHKEYDSSYAELYHWLNRYSDHPDAARIYHIAKRKKPSGQPLPKRASKSSSLKGYGIRDGIGGRSMPHAWNAGLDAWEEKEYHTAADIFGMIAGQKRLSNWQRSGAHYWAYRASKAANYGSKAEYHLQESAMYPFTFYGALAAKQLTPAVYNPKFTKVSQQMMLHPAVRRAAGFVALGWHDKAESELRALYPKLDKQHRRELVTLTAAFDLPGLQLRVSQLQHKNPQQSDITAYPTPGWIPHYDMQVDPALVYAIIRQESAFRIDAKSHAGARGAMQIMPATADYVVDLYNLNHLKLASFQSNGRITRQDLNRPDVNLVVGQHYLQYLSSKSYIDGNVIYMLAAYNAGPGNLIKWQKRYAGTYDPLLFMEKIPFKETRHYIKQVMANYLVYQSLIYGESHSIHALKDGEWPLLRAEDLYAANTTRQYAQR